MPELILGTEPYIPRASIGGSDIGTLLGVNRYGNPVSVYERITAMLNGRAYASTPDNPDMERGRELEPACVRKYERETGRRTIHGGATVVHPTRPYMHANVDRLIVDRDPMIELRNPPDTGILEAKCPRSTVWRATRETGVNPSYYAQLQHYFAVTDLTWGSFAFLNAEDWLLHTFDVERDEPQIAQIFEVCEHFWSMVQAGSFNAQRLAAHTMPIAEETVARAQLTAGSLVRETRVWSEALSNVKECNMRFALAKSSKEAADETLKALVEFEGVEEVVVPGIGKVTYKEQDRTGIDMGRLKDDHPEIVSQYQTITTYPVLRTSFGRR